MFDSVCNARASVAQIRAEQLQHLREKFPYSIHSTSCGEIDIRATYEEAVAFVAECRIDNVGEDGEFTDDFEIRLNGKVIEVFTAGEYHANKKEWSAA